MILIKNGEISGIAKLCVALLSIFFNGSAIGQNKFRELTIGDTIPDVTIENIINYKSTTAHISDFKGKLLIIDFWATWCAPCITAFRKLDSLQKKFADDVQILPVTSEEKEKTYEFLQRMYKVTSILPMSSTNDKIFYRYFKHSTIPHYVWIDGDSREVVAISEANDVTENNIISFKKNKIINFILKKDEDRKLVIGKTLFTPSIEFENEDKELKIEKVRDSSVLFYSTITRYVEGLESAMDFQDSTNINAQNVTLRRLYQVALMGNGLSILNVKTTQVEIPDSSLYRHITGHTLSGKKLSSGLETLAWLRENGYCYSIKVPSSLADQRFRIMLTELNRFFGALYNIEGVLDKRKAKYLSLSRIQGPNGLTSAGGVEQVQSDKLSLRIRNGTIGYLIRSLSLPLQTYPPIVDETGFRGRIDVELNCQLSSLQAVNLELKKYGLLLRERERIEDVAVIRYKP